MTLRCSMAAVAASARIGLAGIAGFSALAGGLATPNAARATVVIFSASGSGSDGPLAAEAQFTTGAGFIDITLTNDLAANVIKSAGQALSDILVHAQQCAGGARHRDCHRAAGQRLRHRPRDLYDRLTGALPGYGTATSRGVRGPSPSPATRS